MLERRERCCTRGVVESLPETQAGATEVWCNDFNPSNHDALVFNLCSSAGWVVPDELQGKHIQSKHSSAQPERPPPCPAGGPEAAAKYWSGSAEEVLPPGLKRHVFQWSGSSSLDGPADSISGELNNITDSRAVDFSKEEAPTNVAEEKKDLKSNVRVSHLDAHR